MIADYICYNKKPLYNIKKLTILRYWKELVVKNKNIERLESNSHLSNKDFNNL